MENSQSGLFKFIWEAVLLPLIKKHGAELIDYLIGKLTQHKDELPVFEVASVTQCDPGYHIENGKCVKDSPIPPDPTHP